MSTALLVLAIASFLPGTVNSSVILLMGLPFLLLSLGGFIAAWTGRRSRAGLVDRAPDRESGRVRHQSTGRLIIALALLFFFLNLDAPLPWATPLYYELAFDVEPWHGADGLERARADLQREGLAPQSIEVTWSLVLIACHGTGCHIGKALRATFPWHQVPGALERCFIADPLRLGLIRRTAFARGNCLPIYTNENRPRSN